MKKSLILAALSLAAGAHMPLALAGEAAVQSIRAERAILLDAAQVGSDILAVGERGAVLRSSDSGKKWSRIMTPIDRTLSAIGFAKDQKIGVAVGHGGSVLRTEDGGATWAQVKLAEAGHDSLLGVTVLGNGTFLAYGAFGMYFESTDGGKSWARKTVVDDTFDRHISQVIETGESALFLVAESGVLASSADKGATWKRLKSPYEGSFFGVLKSADGALLIYGMRGNVFRSTDNGENWEKVELGIKQGLNSGNLAADGRILLAGNGGVIEMSSDNGKTFSKHVIPGNSSLARVLAQADGSLLYVGALASGRIEKDALNNAGKATEK